MLTISSFFVAIVFQIKPTPESVFEAIHYRYILHYVMDVWFFSFHQFYPVLFFVVFYRTAALLVVLLLSSYYFRPIFYHIDLMTMCMYRVVDQTIWEENKVRYST